MRTTNALWIGIAAGAAGGWFAHDLLGKHRTADVSASSVDGPDATGDEPDLAAGQGDRSPISRRDVSDALRGFERRERAGAVVGTRGFVALATLRAIDGDESEFLHLAERALAGGLSIDDILESLGEFPPDKRASLLSTLLERHPNAAFDAGAVARVFVGAGKNDRALALVREALPRQGGFHPDLTRLLLRLDAEGAVNSLFGLESSERWNSDEFEVLRAMLIEANQELRIVPFLERTLDANPADHDALRSLRKVAPAAADARLRALVSTNPDDPTAWALLGEIRRDAGDATGAFDAFKRAAERDPKRRSFRDLVAADPVRGLDVVIGLTKDSADDEMLGALAEMYALTGRKDDAVKAFLRAHAHDPKDLEWIDELVKLDPNAALSVVERRVLDAPGAARDDLIGRYANALRAAGRTDEAFQQYVAAYRKNPDADDWQRALTELDPKAALTILASHVKERPADASGHGNYGVSLAAAGRTAEALAELERALSDGDPGRWYPALRTIDATRALAGLEQRTRTDPANDRVWGLLGRELKALRRDAEARAAYDRAIQIDPSNREWARALREFR